MVRKHRADLRAGGGVNAVICRNDWKIKSVKVTESFEAESVWCKIITPNSEYYNYVASIYHLPDPINDAAKQLDFLV